MKGIYERQVQYYETDRMQIVHHSNYARWFEEARLDFLKKAQVPYDKLEESGILIPVLSVEAQFRMPFKFGDEFRVELKCTRFNGVKCEFEYNVYNKATGELSTVGSSSHCFVKSNMKPFNMRREYPEIFDKLCSIVEV